ncbi:extensin family protein [Ostreiculturibacter nitratireducens]|uniref:extensin-like domain-containing protein n=1 Tax=Ostreiculturibacter nitratireducens TaxID=3075226 RepID=UPI0031B5B11D
MRTLGAAGLVLALLIGGAAQAEAPETSLQPKARPVHAAATDTATEATHRHPQARPGSTAVKVIASGAALPGRRPEPRPHAAQRPAEIVQVAASAAAVTRSIRPEERPENLRRLVTVSASGFRTQPLPEAITGRKGSVCGDPAIKGETIAPIAGRVKGCGLEDGVKVTSVAGVALSTPAIMDCTTAGALRSWVESGVKPAVGRLGGGVAKLQVASSYVCRPRNNQKGEKVSEHGRGRAIDISAIVLENGVAITVLKGWGDGQHGKVLKSMHKAACGPFGTVLGPAANAFHRDHLHLDTARYRGGSFCR